MAKTTITITIEDEDDELNIRAISESVHEFVMDEGWEAEISVRAIDE